MIRHNAADRGEGGFTLVEMLVVVGIIGLLLLVLILGVQGIQMRSKIANTAAFIDALNTACTGYREMFGGREYPPMEPGPTYGPAGNSSKALVTYLGNKLKKQAAYSAIPGIPLPPAEDQKVLMVFTEDQRDGEYLKDIWQRRISYYFQRGGQADPYSGSEFAGHDLRYSDNKFVHVDIVSYGPFEAGKDDDGVDCKISTFRKP